MVDGTRRRVRPPGRRDKDFFPSRSGMMESRTPNASGAGDVALATHARGVEEVLAELDSRIEGLTSAEAAERLRRFGPNLLQRGKTRSLWKILADQLTSVVILLLVVAAGVSLAFGDRVDALAIAAVLAINVGLGFGTEVKARRAMDALLRFDAPRAVVLRDGHALEVPSSDVVPGDIVDAEPGRAVPADARLLRATELRVNEASLTGESLPVSKTADPVAVEAPLPERHDMLYKGTTIAGGAGRAVVVATGMATEIGKIGGLVAGIEDERTPLEIRLDALGRRLVVLAFGVGAAVTVAGLLHGADLATVIKAGIALAIAAVPEGLPAVSTIALAVGVRRMARRNALVRRLPSVETLGSVTVVCTDKTGTLTAGETTTTLLWIPDRLVRIGGVGYAPVGAFTDDGGETLAHDARVELALRIGLLANRSEIEETSAGWIARGDTTDAALLVAAAKGGLSRVSEVAARPEVAELPFSSERMLMATFHRDADGGLMAHAKGAPGRILERCSWLETDRGREPLDDDGRRMVLDRNAELAAQGLRVLALAYGAVGDPAEESLTGLTLVGLAGMVDPPAEGVKETIAKLRGAGIRTVMITGDQKLTANAIAEDLGILGPGQRTLDGRELAALTEAELAAQITGIGAFSRVSPEDKLKIVSAFRDRGDIVGMLGDGVNDAAALKRSDVGVAMGIRGTDVAKEVAVVVLQDDQFKTVAVAVEEGRVIFDNIRKFVFYLFSCNLAEIFVLLGATVVGLPLPLLPLQILWLNLVTDTFPALALAVEPAEPGVMNRPPRDPDEAMLSPRFIRSIAFYGGLITLSSLAAFAYGLADAAADPARASTLCFMTIALAQTFHLGNARGKAPVLGVERAFANPYAVAAVVVVVALQLLAIYWFPLASVLGTFPLALFDLGIVFVLALLPALVGQLLKLSRSKRAAAPAA